MSLLPSLFSDWWEDLDRPHRLWDQYFGLTIDPEDLLEEFETIPFRPDLPLYRPNRRFKRRHHPFPRRGGRRGASTVQPNKDKFLVTLDVQQFAPDEITVKVVGRNIVVEAKHDEKEDEHGWVARQFTRKYIIPEQCDIDQVESSLSSDGILTITAPRKAPAPNESNERTIKIQYTGQPAVTNYQNATNDVSSEMQTEQEGQQQQQQQPQQRVSQQQQRGKKSSTVKAA